MEQNNELTNPYLCGGIFMSQLLRIKTQAEIPNIYRIDKKKKYITEPVMLKALMKIYYLDEYNVEKDKIDSFKIMTSNFKRCVSNLSKEENRITDSDRKSIFHEDVIRTKSKALSVTKDMIKHLLEIKDCKIVINSLLYIIENDSTIKDDDEFYIEGNGQPITKKGLSKIDHIYIEPFLLGVWHYIIMNRFSTNALGKETYQQLFDKGRYKGTPSETIKKIQIISIDDVNNTTNTTDDEIQAESNNSVNDCQAVSEAIKDNYPESTNGSFQNDFQEEIKKFEELKYELRSNNENSVDHLCDEVTDVTDINQINELQLSHNDEVLFNEFKKDFKPWLKLCRTNDITFSKIMNQSIFLGKECIYFTIARWRKRYTKFESRVLFNEIPEIINTIEIYLDHLKAKQQQKFLSDKEINIFKMSKTTLENIYIILYGGEAYLIN